MNIKKNGIDVSEWQGHIDWEKVKPHIDFAVIRLGYGQNTLDSEARRNISECNRLGIPYGVAVVWSPDVYPAYWEIVTE